MADTKIKDLTAYTTPLAADVIPLHKSSDDTDKKVTVANLSLAMNGVYNVKLYGAVGDGATDDTVAIQAAIDACSAAGGGAVYVPPTDDYYLIKYPIVIPSYITTYGDGYKSWIRNVSVVPPVGWGGEVWCSYHCLMVGNIGGTGDPQFGPDDKLTFYDIGAMVKGGITITFDVAGESANFTAGEIVYIHGSALFADAVYGAVHPYFYGEVNEVLSVGVGTLVLKYPVAHNYDAASKIATSAEVYVGLDGQDSYMARNVVIRDLHLSQDHTAGYGLLGTCYKSKFQNLIFDTNGQGGLAFCTLAYSEIDGYIYNSANPVLQYGLEITQYSTNSIARNIFMDRGYINLCETGTGIIIDGFYIGEGGFGTYGKHNVLIRNGIINRIATDSGVILERECENHVAENITVHGNSSTGWSAVIGVLSKGHVIRGCHMIGSSVAGYPAIIIRNTATDYLVTDNVLGEYGARTENDIIYNTDVSSRGICKDNVSFFTDNLLLNGGFENDGAGGADVFANWTETLSGTGTVTKDLVVFHGGAASCKLLTAGAWGVNVISSFAVEPGSRVRLTMECRGDGTHDGLWQLYDYINGAALAAAEHTLITAAAFSTVTHDYTIPAGCYTLQLYLYAPLEDNGYCYWDDVVMRKIS